MFLARALRFFNKISSARIYLIRAEVLQQYKHYDEALIEAQKARDAKDAGAYERELAKGMIVQLYPFIHPKEPNNISCLNKDV